MDFNTRFAALPQQFGKVTITKARYAKNKVAIRIKSDGIWKPVEAFKLESLGKIRHSNRESAYIVSIAQAEKFAKLLGKSDE